MKIKEKGNWDEWLVYLSETLLLFFGENYCN
jgi:hypothetical protein